jgi:hypothetical protein
MLRIARMSPDARHQKPRSGSCDRRQLNHTVEAAREGAVIKIAELDQTVYANASGSLAGNAQLLSRDVNDGHLCSLVAAMWMANAPQPQPISATVIP